MSTWPSSPPSPELPPPPEAVSLLTVRVVLDDTGPEVWRRLVLPGDLHLDRVHDALQQAMGWTHSHLHQFSLGPPYVSPKFLTEFDVEEGDEGTLETEVRLDQVLREVGDELTYEYDFGDGWTHTLVLEQVGPLEPDAGADVPTRPGETAYVIRCLAGEGACPPENVGGLPGYEELAGWVRAGADPAHHFDNGLTVAQMREWLPAGWHPDHFDTDETNAGLARMTPHDTSIAMGQLPRELTAIVERLRGPARLDLDEWLSAPAWASPEHFTREEAVTLTEPFRVVLDAVGEGVTLTPGGYLPGRLVEQVLHGAGLADNWPGKGNREDLTPPVLDLRERGRRFGLLRKAKGRLLPTALAGRLRDDPERLLDHLLSRMAAEGREWERIAGGFVLVATVGGESMERARDAWDSEDAHDSVARIVSVAGFRTPDGDPPSRWDIVFGARLFVDALRILTACVGAQQDEAGAEMTRRVALAVLRRMR